MKPILNALSKITGIDEALFYGLLARSCQGLSGFVTLLMILNFMGPTQQGFYYTFNSLLSLQLVFELGLSFVILQTTAHFFSNLEWTNQGTMTGPDQDVQKTSVFLKQSIKIYGLIALIYSCLLIPAGHTFFGLKANEAVHFSWALPWALVVLGTAMNLCLSPLFAMIEGSGRVKDIYHFRAKLFILSSSGAWLTLYLGYGLFMIAMNVWITVLFSLWWLTKHYRKLVIQLFTPSKLTVEFIWKEEIWPMQWRVAISWISGYFISQLSVPLLFYYGGGVVSGQMGVSLALTNLLSTLCLTWITLRSPQMGRLVAQQRVAELDQLFGKILNESIIAFTLGAIVLGIAVNVANHHGFGHRFLSILPMTMLLISQLFSHITGGFSLYLRAFRKDPFMPFSVVGAILIGTSSWYSAAYFSSTGVCLSLLLVNSLYGFPTTIWLWKHCKKIWATSEVNHVEAFN